MTAPEFAAHLAELAGRVRRELAGGGPRTAWELKLRLKVSQSHLCMALGLLLAEKEVRVAPDQLTYRVEPAGEGSPPAPAQASEGSTAAAPEQAPPAGAPAAASPDPLLAAAQPEPVAR